MRSTAPGFERSIMGEVRWLSFFAWRHSATSDAALQPQDFGARDPTAGELGSNFGEKVLGNWNTEHIIK
jgi:hypothetical protein